MDAACDSRSRHCREGESPMCIAEGAAIDAGINTEGNKGNEVRRAPGDTTWEAARRNLGY